MKDKVANRMLWWGVAILAIVFIVSLVRSCSGPSNSNTSDSETSSGSSGRTSGDRFTQTKEKYIKWNCQGAEGIVLETLYPGDKIEIWHEQLTYAKDNRCSYAAPDKLGEEPHTAKVYGVRDHKPTGFESSLLFPELDPEAVVIVVGDPQDPIHKWRERRQFTSEGQKMVFEGGDTKTFVIIAILNHPKDYYNGQIGMGGYSVTLGVNRKT